MSGDRQRAILDALPGTARQLQRRTRLSKSAVYLQLKKLQNEKLVFIESQRLSNDLPTNVYAVVKPTPDYLTSYEGLT